MSASAAREPSFEPLPPLLPGLASAACRICVTVPVCNEEGTLCACLDALAAQTDLEGKPFPHERYEVLLLLNNCTDGSREIAERWRRAHPSFPLLAAECELASEQAHAGTARRLLMDTAWHRLGGYNAHADAAILATDADSAVAPDWIAQTVAAFRGGADAVGGAIQLGDSELEKLPGQVRVCYGRDRRYAERIALLEDLIDPQPGDPWPRHLDHFGSSLGCTAGAYARAGGMPAVAPLEDEAFVDRLRRADLCLRHEPAVVVFTSARLQGRATVGLAGQLRRWSELPDAQAQVVQSAEYLVHRFSALRRLREAFTTPNASTLAALPETWHDRVRKGARAEATVPAFFSTIDCEHLIYSSFTGVFEQPICEAIHALDGEIAARTADSPTLSER